MTPDPALNRLQSRSLLVGAAGIVAAGIGAVIEPRQFFQSYLFAWVFWMGLVLGSLGIVMLHHMTGGNWGRLVRRLLESGTRTLPLMAVLVIPVLVGIPYIYIWANPQEARNPLVHAKAAWLNLPGFVIRTAIYFAIWFVLVRLLNRRSTENERLTGVSGPGLVIFFLTASAAVVDWVMSLQPEWYSTIFALIVICGQALSTMAFAVAVLILLSAHSDLALPLKPIYLNDLGNLLLAFTMLWAYTSFSQLLIIWAGNLPEEIPYYTRRLYTSWGWVAVAVLLLHFVAPFLLLLMRGIKRNATWLARLAIAIFLVRMLDAFWMIKPAFAPTAFRVSWLDIVTLAGIGGLWLAYFCRQVKERSLVAP